MKRALSIFLTAVLCLSFAGCGTKLEAVAATDTEKQAVIDAAVEFFTGEAYITASTHYEEITGETAVKPEILAAYTVKCDDVDGFAVDLVLCRTKADIAWTSFTGDGCIYDTILFIKDNNSGKIYDSFTYDEIIYNNIMPFETAEEAVLAFFNTPMLRQGRDDAFFWSETEQSTAFKGSDLKEINKALDAALAEFALNPPIFEKVSDDQLVTDAIVKFFEEDTYKNASAHFEKLTGNTPKSPELFAAYTLKCSNIEGFSIDYVLCNVKADIAWETNDGGVVSDSLQFVVDNKTGAVYDSIRYSQKLAEFDGTLDSEEAVAIYCLNHGILFEGIEGENFWNDREKKTCFLGDDLAQFQQALDAVLAE